MGSGILGWLARIALFLALGAAISLFQLDRATASRPELIGLIPHGLGGEADLTRAQMLITTEPTSAESATRSVLQHRPIPAHHLSLRALHLVESDLVEPAGVALTEASKRGWRDLYTQITVLGSALSNGNAVAAAQRLEAIIRHVEEWDVQAAAAEQVLMVPEGREAFAERLAESPGLSAHLVELSQRYANLAPPTGEMFRLASSNGGAIPCEDTASLARRLLAMGEGRPGSDLWYETCGQDDQSGFALQYAANDIDPFGWQFEKGDGVATKPGSQADTLTVANRSPVRKAVAYRFASLPAGVHRFRLQWKAERPSASAGESELDLELKCGGRQSTDLLENSAMVDGEFQFTVPADCDLQVLSLISSRGRKADVKLSKIRPV